MVPCCHAAPRLADDWIWSNYDVKTTHTSMISAAVHCEWQFSERSQGILNHLMLCCKANHLTRWDELFHLNGFHYRHYFPKTEGNFSSEQTTEAAGEKWRAGRWFKDFKGSQLVLFNCWLEPHKWVSDKIRYDQSNWEGPGVAITAKCPRCRHCKTDRGPPYFRMSLCHVPKLVRNSNDDFLGRNLLSTVSPQSYLISSSSC